MSQSVSTRRRQLGAFYTPEHVVTHMVGQLQGLSSTTLLLEPSGGDGAFVRGLLSTGLIKPKQIEVWDINGDCRKPVEATGAHFVQRDGLLGNSTPERFSHIIGNPPYLGKRSDYIRTHRAALQKRYTTIGAHDTYAMFIYEAVRALRTGGQLVFLVSDTFLTLGVHRKLREFLLTTTSIDSITLLPSTVFKGAKVNTTILSLHKTVPTGQHSISFFDERSSPIGSYSTVPTATVRQTLIAEGPASVFVFTDAERIALASTQRHAALLDLVDGGIGMFTNNNLDCIREVSRKGDTSGGGTSINVEDVDGVAWIPYHKRGGITRWWGPAEHAVRWDEESKKGYITYASARAGRDRDGRARVGFVVSGVSSRLSARVMTPGALWDSNKIFGFFPKDPVAWPPEFFVALLNSLWYHQLARALNNTVSLQIRDLRALPLLPFTPEEKSSLIELGRKAITLTKEGRSPEQAELEIDTLVDQAATRAESIYL